MSRARSRESSAQRIRREAHFLAAVRQGFDHGVNKRGSAARECCDRVDLIVIDCPPTLSLLPVNALLYRPEGVQVAEVVQSGGKSAIRLAKIELGRNDGTQVDVLNGLTGSEAVVLNPPDSILDGRVVHVAAAVGGA